MKELEDRLGELPQARVDAAFDARMQDEFERALLVETPARAGVPLWAALAACFVCLFVGIALPDREAVEVVHPEVPEVPSSTEAVLVELRLSNAMDVFSRVPSDDRPWYEKPSRMITEQQ